MRRWHVTFSILLLVIILTFIELKKIYEIHKNRSEIRKHHGTPLRTDPSIPGDGEHIKRQNDTGGQSRLTESFAVKLDEPANLIPEQTANINKTQSSPNIATPNSTYKECAQVQINDVPTVQRAKTSRVPVEFYDLSFHNYYLDDFEYVHLGKDVCSKVETEKFILFVVITDTREDAIAIRQFLRETWGSVKAHSGWTIQTVYLMGSTNDTHRMATIADESKKYGDIIQASCGDAYRDMSLKVMMVLKWVEKYCANAKYVFKGTHDIVVHFGRFFEKINELSKMTKDSDNVFWGCPVTNGYISHHGDKRLQKWAQDSPVVWESRLYPTYLEGSGFLMNMQAVKSVNRLYCRTPVTWPDDTHTSGGVY
ncbi:unnamed protein product [Owenia fusiformis]|uniref:Hexosyltransferase n=1 Tax=Owenia fusiformis TaxID=6347 RepID=A0A8J1V2G2_OWEFU|nr:unnamed protein product [Owenia fusiformis]